MSLSLKELFDSCCWENKHLDELPPAQATIVYKWREEEAEFARPFFSKTGQGIFAEKTCVAERELYLGRDEAGSLILCVTQKEPDNLKDQLPETARQFAALLKADKIIGA